VAASAAFGLLMQVSLLGWMQGQELRQALVTIGVSIIVADQLLAYFGGNSRQFFAPDAIFGSTEVPGVGRYPTFRLVQIGIAVAVGVGLWLLLNRTRLGLMIRAGVDDRQMLAAAGINVPLVSLAVFALGAGLAGLGGVIGSTAQPLVQGVDVRFLLTSLVVVIVGGMGSIAGTALGAIMVGLAEQVGQALFPTYSVILTFVIMAAVLALRPQGILGARHERRADRRSGFGPLGDPGVARAAGGDGGTAGLHPALLRRQHLRPRHRLRHHRDVADLPGHLWRLHVAGADDAGRHRGLRRGDPGPGAVPSIVGGVPYALAIPIGLPPRP
jgi:branched-chain amino acid transport system permease protein